MVYSLKVGVLSSNAGFVLTGFPEYRIDGENSVLEQFGLNKRLGLLTNGLLSLLINHCRCFIIQVGVQIGLFHGGEPLCEAMATSDAIVQNSEATWDEKLSFDLDVCNIPRCARLCLVIYELTKAAKGTVKSRRRAGRQDNNMRPIGWINTMVYDFRNCLKSGPETLYLWTCLDDAQTDDVLHSIATITSNPHMDQATVLTVCFEKYAEHTIMYPTMEEVTVFVSPVLLLCIVQCVDVFSRFFRLCKLSKI